MCLAIPIYVDNLDHNAIHRVWIESPKCQYLAPKAGAGIELYLPYGKRWPVR